MKTASLLMLTLAACYTPPPAGPAPRDGLVIPVSAGRVWDAVVEQFAATSIPIQTMERASGIIVTTDLGLTAANGLAWANCGEAMGSPVAPNHGSYNVLVRGDSATTTLRVTARWTFQSDGATIECTTRNVYEPDLEAAIAQRAEHR
jgi:hypothetical protein